MTKNEQMLSPVVHVVIREFKLLVTERYHALCFNIKLIKSDISHSFIVTEDRLEVSACLGSCFVCRSQAAFC